MTPHYVTAGRNNAEHSASSRKRGEGVREQGEIVAWWGDVGDALGKKSGRFALIGTRLAL